MQLEQETERQLREYEKSQEKYRRLLEAYKQLFETPNGEEVLKDLKNAFYERTSLDENANLVIANEGKRFVVLYIISKLEEANAPRIDDNNDNGAGQ